MAGYRFARGKSPLLNPPLLPRDRTGRLLQKTPPGIFEHQLCVAQLARSIRVRGCGACIHGEHGVGRGPHHYCRRNNVMVRVLRRLAEDGEVQPGAGRAFKPPLGLVQPHVLICSCHLASTSFAAVRSGRCTPLVIL